MGTFPYPLGSYGVADTVVLDGEPHMVVCEPRLKEWMESKGLDYDGTYRVTTVSAFGNPVAVKVNSFKRKQGKLYTTRFRNVARRFPQLVKP
jgi:hypothetical protein